MNRVYTILIASFVLSSCGAHLKYLGSHESTTSKVDIFVDPNAISRPFTLIGKGYEGYHPGQRIRSLEKSALRLAKKNGADAILFEESSQVTAGLSTTGFARYDTISGILQSNTVSAPLVSYRRNILFLKYR